MYTIQQEVGHLDNLKIGLVGDLANGRTVRSLAYLLSMYNNVKMYFVAPDAVRMKDDIKEFLTGRQVLVMSCCIGTNAFPELLIAADDFITSCDGCNHIQS